MHIVPEFLHKVPRQHYHSGEVFLVRVNSIILALQLVMIVAGSYIAMSFVLAALVNYQPFVQSPAYSQYLIGPQICGWKTSVVGVATYWNSEFQITTRIKAGQEQVMVAANIEMLQQMILLHVFLFIVGLLNKVLFELQRHRLSWRGLTLRKESVTALEIFLLVLSLRVTVAFQNAGIVLNYFVEQCYPNSTNYESTTAYIVVPFFFITVLVSSGYAVSIVLFVGYYWVGWDKLHDRAHSHHPLVRVEGSGGSETDADPFEG